jgi:hypothetical protein
MSNGLDPNATQLILILMVSVRAFWSVTRRTANLFARAALVAARVGTGKPQIALIILG